jgi:hypothetical protein
MLFHRRGRCCKRPQLKSVGSGNRSGRLAVQNALGRKGQPDFPERHWAGAKNIAEDGNQLLKIGK